MTWLEELGFEDNPFYLEPVSPEKQGIAKGFVNRLKERRVLDDFIQLKSGSLLLLGRVGEGKSSILNLLQYQVCNLGKVVFRIDVQRHNTKQAFIEELLKEIKNNSESLPKPAKEKIDKSLDDLKIESRKAKKGEKVGGSVEGKLSAIIASLSGKVHGEEASDEEIEYYVPPRIRRLETITKDVLPSIFKVIPSALICDNLEKLGVSDFQLFLKDVVSIIPENTLFVTTGSIDELDSKTLQKCYDVFSIVLLMQKIASKETLREFIEGRIIAYSKTGKIPLRFNDESINLLLDRTSGNLRECFRYCYQAIQMYKSDITRGSMIKAIKECDMPRLAVLSETDKKLLSLVAEEENATIKNIFNVLKEEENIDSPDTVRKRLDNLSVIGFVRKKAVKSGRTYVTVYTVPDSIIELIKEE